MSARGSLDLPRVLQGGAAADTVDPRVGAVLEVLAGEPAASVAIRWSVDQAVLHRWVHSFVEAGIAQVTHTPSPDVARQRDRFLAAFTHQLRTPLAVAQGWVGILTDGDVAPETATAALARLQDALDRLAERTVDVELLTAAMLGRLRLSAHAVPIGDLTQSLPGLRGVGGEGSDVEVSVDPELFGRILRDLWDAAGAHPRPRAMRLEVVTLDPWVELRIIRQGDPIDPHILQALFEPFDANDGATGVTVGLYLARALIVVHGGTVGVDQDDNGAVFWVRIPGVRPRQGDHTGREGEPMKFKLACGDVMPGCAARFESTDRDQLMSQIATHAAESHGITTITPEVAGAVESKIVVLS